LVDHWVDVDRPEVFGRGGYRQHNTLQVEELVSHGYIVAAIDQRCISSPPWTRPIRKDGSLVWSILATRGAK
jgi:hypothetical protein